MIGSQNPTVVADPEWFVEVINHLISQGSEMAGSLNIPCLAHDTCVWLDRGLLKLGWDKLDKDTVCATELIITKQKKHKIFKFSIRGLLCNSSFEI